MFFLKEETKIISLHPSYFGPNMRDYLVARLNEEEEGRCTGDHFVICVMDMVDIGEGRVIPSSGNAEYTIKYRAIIWKPFRGETVCVEDRALGSGSQFWFSPGSENAVLTIRIARSTPSLPL